MFRDMEDGLRHTNMLHLAHPGLYHDSTVDDDTVRAVLEDAEGERRSGVVSPRDLRQRGWEESEGASMDGSGVARALFASSAVVCAGRSEGSTGASADVGRMVDEGGESVQVCTPCFYDYQFVAASVWLHATDLSHTMQ